MVNQAIGQSQSRIPWITSWLTLTMERKTGPPKNQWLHLRKIFFSINMSRKCRNQNQIAGVAEEDHANHGKTTSKTGQARRCRHCCAYVRGQRAVIATDVGVPQRRLGVTSIS